MVRTDAPARNDTRPRSGSNRRQRQAIVGVRVLPDERAQLRAAAAARHVSISELLRSAALREIASA